MDRRYEFAGCETEKDAWRDIMFADAVAELKVLVEHRAEGQGDGLAFISEFKKQYVRGGIYFEVDIGRR